MAARDIFAWHGDQLRWRGRRKPVVSIERDQNWHGMWRVVLPDGSRTDMFNRARAKDNAKSILAGLLNRKAASAEAR
jgi:hypothetical protein